MNIPEHVELKIGKNLHNTLNHPINTVKEKIFSCFPDFNKFDDISPFVSTSNNFDKLLIPDDHVSRSLSDTYYKDEVTVLRTHTSAHQNDLLMAGYKSFLVAGDCFRRDEIDSCHYPVFHQIEGVKIVDDEVDVADDLRVNLEGVINSLFGDCEFRMREHKFPFTQPSWEVDVFYNNDWLEVLGCGVVHEKIMNNCGLAGQKAWAFGMGIDRLAMILFKIPDIRLMWSEDKRFHDQFDGSIFDFKPFSKYPPCHKDVSMWIGDSFCENSMNEIFRECAGDMVESVLLIDSFEKNDRKSNCYRVTYRSMDQSLTHNDVNLMHDKCVHTISRSMDCEMR